MLFKVFNKMYQPIILIDGTRILPRNCIVVEKITEQIRNLEFRNLVLTKKL